MIQPTDVYMDRDKRIEVNVGYGVFLVVLVKESEYSLLGRPPPPRMRPLCPVGARGPSPARHLQPRPPHLRPTRRSRQGPCLASSSPITTSPRCSQTIIKMVSILMSPLLRLSYVFNFSTAFFVFFFSIIFVSILMSVPPWWTSFQLFFPALIDIYLALMFNCYPYFHDGNSYDR